MTDSAAAQEPRWRRLPEERPKQILDAALEEFAQRGLGHARLEDIGKRAGVSKGTIYLYFPNKEALFREVVQSTIVDRLESAEREIASSTRTATDLLRQVMRKRFEFLRSPTFVAVFRLVNAEIYNFPDLAEFYAEEVVLRSQRMITGVIRRGSDSGEFRPMDAAVAARMLTSMFLMHGLWCSNRQCFPHLAQRSDEQVLEELMAFALSALSARDGAA